MVIDLSSEMYAFYDTLGITFEDIYEALRKMPEEERPFSQSRVGVVWFPTDCTEPRCRCLSRDVPEEIADEICEAAEGSSDNEQFTRRLEEIERRHGVTLVLLVEYDTAVLVLYD